MGNNQKSRLVNFLYKLVASVSKGNVQIHRDPLHRRYEVNRWGIVVKPINGLQLDYLRRCVVAALVKRGYTFDGIVYKSFNGDHAISIEVGQPKQLGLSIC